MNPGQFAKEKLRLTMWDKFSEVFDAVTVVNLLSGLALIFSLQVTRGILNAKVAKCIAKDAKSVDSSMIVTSEAIVLRSRKQGDSSRIITLYTKDHGKLNVIAKGAREMRSPFSSALQLFNHLSVVFYKKENRDLYLLSKAETITKMTGIQQSMEQLTAASKIVDLVQRAMHDEQADPKLFDLLVGALKHIADDPPQRAAVLASYFYFHFAAHEGFAIKLPAETESERYILNIQTGEISQANISASTIDHRFILVSAKALGLIRSFSRNAIPTGPAAMDLLVTDEVEAILEKFLRTHIESFRKLKVS